MQWKSSVLSLFAVAAFSFLSMGCGGQASQKPITPEEAKAIVGEDTEYLPGDTKAARKP